MLNQENIPIDLAVIPLMESGNNPQAKSPKDALGLWQFISPTAREWGLINNINNDERRNVIKSTKTAIKYLKYLHNELNDWNLALAAYNWGIGNVKKSLKKGLVRNKKINIDLLPKETRRYLLAFHHLNRLIKTNYKRQILDKFPNKNYLEIIKQKDLRNYLVANNLANISPDVLLHINGFDVNSDIEVNKSILVPTKVFKEFFSLSDTQFTYKNINTKNSVNCNKKFYKARQHDTLIKVAKKFNLKLDSIREMNPRVRFVRPGMSLQVCR
ncbi:transglycosylase SLT domain-containing protein [Methylophilaceae bacterium]|nr:transglycosylase SLT domain-containing protein [Methylophilaceae bacterium]